MRRGVIAIRLRSCIAHSWQTKIAAFMVSTTEKVSLPIMPVIYISQRRDKPYITRLIQTRFVWQQPISNKANPQILYPALPRVEMAGDACLQFPSLPGPFPIDLPISLATYTYSAAIMRRNKAAPW
jgi:hypothetical protein